MLITRRPGPGTFIEVLDRVLDHGIIIDAWARVSPAGIDLAPIDARLIVASTETYLEYAVPPGAGAGALPASGTAPRRSGRRDE